jgi:hypothetical protein
MQMEPFYGGSFVCRFHTRDASDRSIRVPVLAHWFRFVPSPVTAELAELPNKKNKFEIPED